jgi:hypothetical protein
VFSAICQQIDGFGRILAAVPMIRIAFVGGPRDSTVVSFELPDDTNLWDQPSLSSPGAFYRRAERTVPTSSGDAIVMEYVGEQASS